VSRGLLFTEHSVVFHLLCETIICLVKEPLDILYTMAILSTAKCLCYCPNAVV